MKDADTTWALVVGIDVYDNVKGLKGPVRDAISVVEWLRNLGITDEHILLHAAPCPETQQPLTNLGLAYQGCTEPEIWISLSKLLNNNGSRLLVFLLGHGYYLFDGGPVFLTQEADGTAPTNIGITWLSDILRARNYQRQFIVMDGCLNYAYSEAARPTIGQGTHNGVLPKPALASVRQWFAYAASQGQVAAEPNGRGLFTTALLAALDLTAPNPLCTAIDDATGTYELDLNTAITDVVYKAVTEKIPTQQPGIRRLDSGPADPRAIIATITPQQTVALQTLIDPATAAPEVDNLTLATRTFQWKRTIPDPRGSALNLPHTYVLPAGLRLNGWCEMKPNTDWADPPPETVTTGSGVDLVFKLQRDRSTHVVKVTTVDTDATEIAAMNSTAITAATNIIAGAGAHGRLWLAPSRTGAFVYARAGEDDDLDSVSRRIAAAINRHTDPDVRVTLERQQLPTTEPELRWHGWMLDIDLDREQARTLGGFLTDLPVVGIGGRADAMSLQALADLGHVAIDGLAPARVELDLPWGRWVTLVEPPPTTGKASRLVFPRTVGLPPVRNGLLDTVLHPESPTAEAIKVGEVAFALAVVTNEPTTLHVTIGDQFGPLFVGDDGTGDWIAVRGPKPMMHGDGTFYDDVGLAKTGRAIGRLDVASSTTPLYFPMSPNLAFDDRTTPRIEPLSVSTSPLWDLLVGAGHLDALDRRHVRLIVKTGDPVLAIAAMYGCYINDFGEELFTLQRFFEHTTDQPDVVILRHAYEMKLSGSRAIGNVDELVALATDNRVPVFKWGIAIGQAVAQHFEVPALAAKFRYIEDRLMTGSNWTLWQGDHGNGRPEVTRVSGKLAARRRLRARR